jgi:(p)ppGpp synthase/HD superfamily hydrolase
MKRLTKIAGQLCAEITADIEMMEGSEEDKYHVLRYLTNMLEIEQAEMSRKLEESKPVLTKSDVIVTARSLAKQLHAGQKRKDGKDYFTHVQAVADIVRVKLINYAISDTNVTDEEVVAAAYLHDTIEDCGITPDDLINAGFSSDVVDIVLALSRPKGETYFDFIRAICSSFQGAMIIKLADLEHNMSDLEEGSLKDKYRFAKHMIETELGI